MCIRDRAGYYLREQLWVKAKVDKAKTKELFLGLDQEKMELGHQLKAVRIIHDAIYTDQAKDEFIQDMVEIFSAYLKERRQEMTAAFKAAGVVGRCLGLRTFREDAQTYRAEILSYSQDSDVYKRQTPSFRVLPDGTIRPVYLYTVDADEFVVNKLLDRGSLSATTIVTNVQDFISIVAKGLGVMK